MLNGWKWTPRRAAEKQKEMMAFAVRTYKQATPTRFGRPSGTSPSNHDAEKMWVKIETCATSSYLRPHALSST
jgi:hypothetical protein